MRTRTGLALATLLAGIGVLGALWRSSGTQGAGAGDVSTRSGFPVDPTPGSAASPAAEALAPAPSPPAVGPNGRPLEDLEGRTLRAEGLKGPRPVAPPTDAAGWETRRTAADEVWLRDMSAATSEFARGQGWSPAETSAVELRITAFTADVARTRSAVRARSLSPSEGRAALAALRATVDADLASELGSERAAALRAHLAARVHGGGW